MTSNKAIVNQKIDKMAKTAKTAAEKVINDAAEVASRAAGKAGKHVHDAGKTVKDAGEKIMKLAD